MLGEPNDLETGENCLQLWTGNQSVTGWNDEHCIESYRYICEKRGEFIYWWWCTTYIYVNPVCNAVSQGGVGTHSCLRLALFIVDLYFFILSARKLDMY